MKGTEDNYIARYWEKLSADLICCRLCPRNCQLKPGQRGFCFGRMNVGGKLILTTYGQSSGFCIDPIEKKPLNHFYPGSQVLSFGTAGCNLGCRFCQNWDLSRAEVSGRVSQAASPHDIAVAAKDSGCLSVAFTYNDPVVFAEYAIDTAQACQALGIRTVAVTAGYISSPAREDFFAVMDAANVDLKAFNNDFYEHFTGGSLQPVLDTLVHIKTQTRVWLEITSLLIPGENDSDDEISSMSQWIFQELGPDVPVHFSAFHPAYQMRDVPVTPARTLTRARQIALDNGLQFVYTGNVHDREGDRTLCRECGKILIERDWFKILQYNLDHKGQCPSCGTICPGLFSEAGMTRFPAGDRTRRRIK